MSAFTKMTTSFILALFLFVTLALVLPPPKMSAPGNESIISKSALMGYSKHLDNYYFHLGSLLIPLGSLFFCQIQKRGSSLYGLGLLLVWGIGLFWLILKNA